MDQQLNKPLKMKIFSLNHYVGVKLTPKGIDRYITEQNIILSAPGLEKYLVSHEDVEKKIDKNGYCWMQMHELMNYFGDTWLTDYMELNVLFDEKDLENYEN